MNIINNYVESFLFHLNEIVTTTEKALGLEFHYVNGWNILFSTALTMAMIYFLGKSNIFEWIDKYDVNNRYSFIIIQATLLGLIYLVNGIQGVLLLLFVTTLLFSFYYIVLRNKKYAWLKEMIYKLF